MKLLFERGFKAKPRAYELTKYFPEHAFYGTTGSHTG